MRRSVLLRSSRVYRSKLIYRACFKLSEKTHPNRVVALVLRGIFTLRKTELNFFYQDGASREFPIISPQTESSLSRNHSLIDIHPEAFDEYAAVIPAEERGDFVKAYNKRLMSDNAEVR